MKKLFAIILVLSLVISNLLIAVPKAKAVGPNLVVDLTAKKYAVGTSYSDSTSVATGDVVVLLVTITNTATGTTSQNTTVQAVFPTTYSSSHTVTFNVTSTNASSASDTTAISITDTTGRLVLKPSTTLLTWNNGTTTVTNGVAPDEIVTPGMNFGDLISGGTYAITLVFQANVVAGSNPTNTPTPTPTPGASSSSPTSSSSPSQPKSCSDAKPANAVLTSVSKVSPTSVKVTWSKADKANNYAISYGIGSKSYQFGVDRTSDATEYVVNDLDPSQTYYFAVVSINGCTPGELSNELSTAPSFIAVANAKESQTTKSQLGTSSAQKKENKPVITPTSQKPEQKVLGFFSQKKVVASVLALAITAFVAQNLIKKTVQIKKPMAKKLIKEKTIFKAKKIVKKTSLKKRKK